MNNFCQKVSHFVSFTVGHSIAFMKSNCVKIAKIIAKLFVIRYLVVAYHKIQITYEVQGYSWYVKLKCPSVTFTL